MLGRFLRARWRSQLSIIGCNWPAWRLGWQLPQITYGACRCMQASVRRSLGKRCAHRADGAPGLIRWRFRRSEKVCGQGRGRTADLPLFRSTALSAVQTSKNGRH
jgi:hypothetical protein